MPLTGRQKAAMLLMSLDPVTASEFLKGVDENAVRELAVEAAYLDAAGFRNSKQDAEITQEFCNALKAKKSFQINSFLTEMLNNTVGEDKASHIQTELQGLLHKRDPFIDIRSANSGALSSILNNEHPQAAAVVLSELSAKKSSEVMGFLGEGVRISVIGRMTSAEAITPEAKARIAEMVRRKLKAADTGSAAAADPEQSLRKVAVILRNMGKDLRDGLLEKIGEKDEEASEKVSKLMIIWEDIPQVSDRPLQEALRGIDSSKLALALVKADAEIIEKIKANISERAVVSLEEEASLMSDPKKEEIEDAREEIVETLRKMNENGELSFIEE
jgi:flagellar motor switch protein FliG